MCIPCEETLHKKPFGTKDYSNAGTCEHVSGSVWNK